MARRIWLALIAVLAVVSVPSLAGAANVATLKAERARLSAELESAGKAYRKAMTRLEDNEDRIADLQKRSSSTKKELAAAQANLRARAATIYRMGELDFVSVILGSTDYDDLFTRMDFVRTIVDQDAAQIREVKELRAKLAAEQKSLKAARSTLERNASAERKRRQTLEAQMKAKQREYEAAKKSLGPGAALVRTGNAPAGPNGMVFPVDGPCYYSNTFGAPRSGGRTHKGTDIMASHGVPCVAVTSGTISSKEGGLGGKVIYLNGDNGWRFYYAHLQGWAVRSGRVSAGQLIGYVGSTGNADAGAPHLHFQMWAPGGSLVNPYSYLRQMER